MNIAFMYFQQLTYIDYTLLVICFLLWVFYLFLWLDKIIKSYIWIIFWLAIFIFISLFYMNFQEKNYLVNWIGKIIFENEKIIFNILIFLIIFLGIIYQFNSNFNFSEFKKSLTNKIFSFILGFSQIIFLIFILNSLKTNNFLFQFDENILNIIWEIWILKLISHVINNSFILKSIIFLQNYFLIIFIFIIFIKITIWNFLINILNKIFNFFKNTFKIQKKSSKKDEVEKSEEAWE